MSSHRVNVQPRGGAAWYRPLWPPHPHAALVCSAHGSPVLTAPLQTQLPLLPPPLLKRLQIQVFIPCVIDRSRCNQMMLSGWVVQPSACALVSPGRVSCNLHSGLHTCRGSSKRGCMQPRFEKLPSVQFCSFHLSTGTRAEIVGSCLLQE